MPDRSLLLEVLVLHNKFNHLLHASFQIDPLTPSPFLQQCRRDIALDIIHQLRIARQKVVDKFAPGVQSPQDF